MDAISRVFFQLDVNYGSVYGELLIRPATGHATHYKRAPLFGVGFDRSIVTYKEHPHE